jgi:hypothetical protein
MTNAKTSWFLVAAAVALAVIAGSAASPQTGRWVSAADPGGVQLTVDGEPQPVDGAITCKPTHVGDAQIILVGSQVDVELNRDGSNVTSVGLHTPAVNLQWYKSGYDNGHAAATVAGSTYTVTGAITGTGLNGALKPFELDVTCP